MKPSQPNRQHAEPGKPPQPRQSAQEFGKNLARMMAESLNEQTSKRHVRPPKS